MEVRVERCAERSRVKEANIQGSTPNMQYQSRKGSRRSKLGPQIEHPASSRDWEVVEPPDRMDGCARVGARDDVLPNRNAEARLCLQMKLAYRADAIMIWCEGLLMFRWGRATATIFFSPNRACLIKSVFHRRSKISAAGAGDVLSQRSFDVTGTRGRFSR